MPGEMACWCSPRHPAARLQPLPRWPCERGVPVEDSVRQSAATRPTGSPALATAWWTRPALL